MPSIAFWCKQVSTVPGTAAGTAQNGVWAIAPSWAPFWAWEKRRNNVIIFIYCSAQWAGPREGGKGWIGKGDVGWRSKYSHITPLPTTISWSFFWVRYHEWWMTRSLPVINTYFFWFLKWLKQAGIEMVCLDWYRNHLFLTFWGIEQQKLHGIIQYSPDIFF